MYYLRFYIKWPFLISLDVSPLLERTPTQYLPSPSIYTNRIGLPTSAESSACHAMAFNLDKELRKEQKQFKLQLLKWEGD